MMYAPAISLTPCSETCLVLTGMALDGVSAVGLEDTDGDVLYEPMTADDLALTDPATDTQS